MLPLVFSCIALLPAQGQATVVVDRVPRRLTFPVPADTKVPLVAVIKNGKPKAVWIAVGEQARVRIMLTRAGAATFEVDLAMPVVYSVLRHSPRWKRFHVFAELESGEVIQSEAVPYQLAKTTITPIRYRLFLKHKEEPVSLSLFERRWFDLAEVRRIEVEFGASNPVPTAEARSEKSSWPLVVDRKRQVLELRMRREIRAGWQAAGKLRIEVERGEHGHSSITLRARPNRLSFPGDHASLSIVQRHSGLLPGSNGFYRVSCGDVTRGQVEVTIDTLDGTAVLAPKSLRLGRKVEFQVGETRYQLVLEQLVNKLIGNDYVVFNVSAPELTEREKIDALLLAIETSGVTFVREGKPYDGKQAAAHLRMKLSFAGRRASTLDEFIDGIASRSSTTGEPYQVRTATSKYDAGMWLRRLTRQLAKNGWKQPGK